MMIREIYSAIAIALTIFAFYPYVRSILLGYTRPHVFSWVIWGTTTFIVFLAQVEGGGGVGAWPIGVSGCITILIAILAYHKRADINITSTDWLFFIAAMTSVPIWFFTADPVWAVVILTVVDVLGFGPTIRKAYNSPFSESMLFYALFAVRNLLVIMALERYSVTTVLFPAIITGACALLIGMLMYRRRVLLENLESG